MAFRKFGGIEFNKKNNYVSANVNNNMNLNVTEQIGSLNTKIVAKSHIDLDGQTLFNVGNVIFANGLSLEQMLGNIAFTNDEALQSIFVKNNLWSGINEFTNTTILSTATINDVSIKTAQITNTNITNAIITDSVILTANIYSLTSIAANIDGAKITSLTSTNAIINENLRVVEKLDVGDNFNVTHEGAIKGESLTINNYGINNNGVVTGSTANVEKITLGDTNTVDLTCGANDTLEVQFLNIGTTGWINMSPIITKADGVATETGNNTFSGSNNFTQPTEFYSISVPTNSSSFGINNSGSVIGSSLSIATDYGISSGGTVTGSSLSTTNGYGVSSGGTVTGSSLSIATDYGISSGGAVVGTSLSTTNGYGVSNSGALTGSSMIMNLGTSGSLTLNTSNNNVYTQVNLNNSSNNQTVNLITNVNNGQDHGAYNNIIQSGDAGIIFGYMGNTAGGAGNTGALAITGHIVNGNTNGYGIRLDNSDQSVNICGTVNVNGVPLQQSSFSSYSFTVTGVIATNNSTVELPSTPGGNPGVYMLNTLVYMNTPTTYTIIPVGGSIPFYFTNSATLDNEDNIAFTFNTSSLLGATATNAIFVNNGTQITTLPNSIYTAYPSTGTIANTIISYLSGFQVGITSSGDLTITINPSNSSGTWAINYTYVIDLSILPAIQYSI